MIEAHMLLLVVHKNSDHFSLMREVTDSKPPITDSWIDLCVKTVACADAREPHVVGVCAGFGLCLVALS